MLPKVFDSISRFRQEDELPYLDSLDAYVGHIVPKIRAWGEDLQEEEFFLETKWLEFRSSDSFQDVVVHIFRDGREYMRSTNGDIKRGSWEVMEGTNNMILDSRDGTELYNLVFLNPHFFILKKHGGKRRPDKPMYFVMGNERTVGHLTWREYAEALDQVFEKNNSIVWIIGGAIVFLVAIFILLSRY